MSNKAPSAIASPAPQRPYKLAYFVSHPIQYQAPLLKQLSANPAIELTVFFLSNASTGAYYDPGFGHKVAWDVPLTDGYKHTFLDSTETGGYYSFLNPKVSLSSVKKAVRSEQWDAVWIHGYNNLALLYVIYYCFRTNLPLLFRGESNLISTSKGFAKDAFIRFLVRHAHALLWISSDNKDYYKQYGAKDSQLFFVPYAVDNEFFQSFRLNRDTAREKTIFLFASKFIARKQAPLVVESYAQLDSDLRSRSELWMIGSGDEVATVERLIAHHKLQSDVKLLGFKNQTELPEYFNQCDVFVLASSQEPFGLVINEVMNFGKALIVSDEVGAARDLVDHSENGWVVSARDKAALSRAMAEAIQDPTSTQAMGENSLKKINRWSYNEDIEGILDALQTIDIQDSTSKS